MEIIPMHILVEFNGNVVSLLEPNESIYCLQLLSIKPLSGLGKLIYAFGFQAVSRLPLLADLLYITSVRN